MIQNKFKSLLNKIQENPFKSSSVFVLMIWAMIPYLVANAEKGIEGSNITSYFDGLWWGIVTILTIGYGDRFPITTEGRIWASIMMLAGVVGISILTAKVSSVFLEKALRDRRGFVDSKTLNQHFIICGWKNEMHAFLSQMLKANTDLKAKDIVLVNNIAESEMETLKEIPLLKDIKFIKGDFFTVDIIKRAAPEKARKILIVADMTPGIRGQIPTLSEADARTVMTCMTLNNIAKGIPIAAEILDEQMDQYLKLAGVHEIIYSRDYSRHLLAKASMGVGVTNVYHDLIDPESSHLLTTFQLPDSYFSKTYTEVKNQFESEFPQITLLGILENSGNSHLAKEKALKKAQQTPNINELVKNLQKVKELRFNHPVFNPSKDYVVQEGSMGIIIKEKELT